MHILYNETCFANIKVAKK